MSHFPKIALALNTAWRLCEQGARHDRIKEEIFLATREVARLKADFVMERWDETEYSAEKVKGG